MASTNQTVHYDLSQYTANDKPTYLVDYNGDMAKIDAGIYNAESKALINESAIGDLTDLNTTAKNDLVSAINEVEGEVGDNTTAISNLNTSVSANTGNIGTMANLNTTDKSNLVNAINEVNTKAHTIDNFNLVNFKSYSSGTDVTVTNASISANEVTVATNSDGSLFKFYGQINLTDINGTVTIRLSNTGISPKSAFTINSAGIRFDNNVLVRNDINVESNGDIVITVVTVSGRLFFYPALYFANDFGDVPSI